MSFMHLHLGVEGPLPSGIDVRKSHQKFFGVFFFSLCGPLRTTTALVVMKDHDGTLMMLCVFFCVRPGSLKKVERGGVVC